MLRASHVQRSEQLVSSSCAMKMHRSLSHYLQRGRGVDSLAVKRRQNACDRLDRTNVSRAPRSDSSGPQFQLLSMQCLCAGAAAGCGSSCDSCQERTQCFVRLGASHWGALVLRWSQAAQYARREPQAEPLRRSCSCLWPRPRQLWRQQSRADTVRGVGGSASSEVHRTRAVHGCHLSGKLSWALCVPRPTSHVRSWLLCQRCSSYSCLWQRTAAAILTGCGIAVRPQACFSRKLCATHARTQHICTHAQQGCVAGNASRPVNRTRAAHDCHPSGKLWWALCVPRPTCRVCPCCA